MQNTTTSNENPTKLIENFFISGMRQDQLKAAVEKKIDGTTKINTAKLTNQTPDVLFSMYADKNKMRKYVQFIFPDKCSVSISKEKPIFHTFECSDENGNQSFFHCLRFTEELNEIQLEDMDYENLDAQVGNIDKQKKNLKKKNNERHQKMALKIQQVEVDEGDNMFDIVSMNANLKKQERMKNGLGNKQIKTINNYMHVPVSAQEEIKEQLAWQENKNRKDTVQLRNESINNALGDIGQFNFDPQQELRSKEGKKSMRLQRPRNVSGGDEMDFSDGNKLDYGPNLLNSRQFVSQVGQHFVPISPNSKTRHVSNYQKRDMIIKEVDLKRKETEVDFESQGELSSNSRFSKRSVSSHMTTILDHSANRQTKFMMENINIKKKMNIENRKQKIAQLNQLMITSPTKTGLESFITSNNVPESPYGLEKVNDQLNRLNGIGMSQVASQIEVSGQLQVPNFQALKTPSKDYRNTPNFNAFNLYKEEQSIEQHLKTDVQSFISNNNIFNARNEALKNIKLESEMINNKLRKLDVFCYYAPIAFIIQSKVEFHDSFKFILQKIYESIRDIKTATEQQNEAWDKNIITLNKKLRKNKIIKRDLKDIIPGYSDCLVFSEILMNMAFLRTIPAPVFNSEVHINFMGFPIELKENHFHEIPHKNTHSIKVLMDCLDFHSILTCIKALIFEKTLIVASLETSLLFNVIEGFKQLMFPFTFDYQQFLPANDVYEDHAGNTLKSVFESFQGMQPVIFAWTLKLSNKRGYSHDIEDYYNWPDSVLLDIDASFVQATGIERPLPTFQNELQYLRILNRYKNRMFDNYDKIYMEEQGAQQINETNFMIQSVREVFFTMFQPYLIAAFKAINPKNNHPKNINDFFEDQAFIDSVVQQCEDNLGNESTDNARRAAEFATQLLTTRTFVHFMDGYLSDDVTNFDLVNSILCFRGELHERFKSSSVTLAPYSEYVQQKMLTKQPQQLIKLENEYNKYKEKQKEFQDPEVIFEYSLPTKRERMQLLEKIEFIVNKRFNQCKGNYQRSSNQPRESQKNNKQLDELKCFEQMKITICYQEIIQLLKEAYSDKNKAPKANAEGISNSNNQFPSQGQALAESGFSPGIQEHDEQLIGKSLVEPKEQNIFANNNAKISRKVSMNPIVSPKFNEQEQFLFKPQGDGKKKLANKPSMRNLQMDGQYNVIEDEMSEDDLEFEDVLPKPKFENDINIIEDSSPSNQNQQIASAYFINEGNNGSGQRQKENEDNLDASDLQKSLFNNLMVTDRNRMSSVMHVNFAANVGNASSFMHSKFVDSNQKQLENSKFATASKVNLHPRVQDYTPLDNPDNEEYSLQRSGYEPTFHCKPGEVQKFNFESVPESLREEPKQKEQSQVAMKLQMQTIKIDDSLSEMTGFDGFLGDVHQLHVQVNNLKEKKMPKKDKNSVNCIYGQKGLLQFMSNMFSLLNEQDRSQINFYFTIRDFMLEHCYQMSNKSDSNSRETQFQFLPREGQDDNMPKQHRPTFVRGNTIMNRSFVSAYGQIGQFGVTNDRSTIMQRAEVGYTNKFENALLQESDYHGRAMNTTQNQGQASISLHKSQDVNQENPQESEDGSRSEKENNLWFSIIKKNMGEEQDHLTYQEVLVFTKLINSFEERRHQGPMTLWLMLQYPLNSLQLLIFETNKIKKMFRASQINSAIGGAYDLMDQEGFDEDESDDQQDVQLYQHTSKLEFLFPLNMFKCVLDNFTSHQIIDLFLRISGGAQQNHVNNPYINYEIDLNKLDRDTVWTIPNNLCGGDMINCLYYKDLLKLLIKERFEETINNLQFEKYMYQKLSGELEQINSNGISKEHKHVKIYERLYQSKRDNMKNGYFEVVDERLFSECSIEKYNLELTYQKCLEQIRIKYKPANTRDAEQPNLIVQQRSASNEKKSRKGFFSKLFGVDTKKEPTTTRNKDKKKMFVPEAKVTANFGPLINQLAEYDRESVEPENNICFTSIDDFQKLQNERGRDTIQRRKEDQLPIITLMLDQLSELGGSHIINKNRKVYYNPLRLSLKFLLDVINFWSRKENAILLDKGAVFDGNHNEWPPQKVNDKPKNKTLKDDRIDTLTKIFDSRIRAFEQHEFDFNVLDEKQKQEIIDFKMSREEYCEIVKQCFFINVYNSMILFKLAEISVLKSTRLFTIQGYNSFIALQQQTKINISGQILTAYQIKNQIVKNVKKKEPSSFECDRKYIHPLVEYAFFMPVHNTVKMSELVFSSVVFFKEKFARMVKKMIQNNHSILVNSENSLIVLPASLKDCFQPESVQELSENFARQKYILRVLKFVQAEIYQLGMPNQTDLGNREISKVIKNIETCIYGKQTSSFGNSNSTTYRPTSNGDYMIEFTCQAFRLKPSKILKGLKEAHDILKKQIDSNSQDKASIGPSEQAQVKKNTSYYDYRKLGMKKSKQSQAVQNSS